MPQALVSGDYFAVAVSIVYQAALPQADRSVLLPQCQRFPSGKLDGGLPGP